MGLKGSEGIRLLNSGSEDLGSSDRCCLSPLHACGLDACGRGSLARQFFALRRDPICNCLQRHCFFIGQFPVLLGSSCKPEVRIYQRGEPSDPLAFLAERQSR